MKNGIQPSFRIVTAIVFGGFTQGALSNNGEVSTSLPPPPTAMSAEQVLSYQLELVINQYATGEVVPVTLRHGAYFVAASALLQAGIRKEKLAAGEVNVSALPGSHVHYESESQRLLLDVPPEWLQPQSFSGDEVPLHYPAQSNTGALLNYDIYASRADRNGNQLSVGNELRLFSPYGYLSNSGLVNQRRSEGSSHYLCYDTTLGNFDEQHALSWRAGDLITNALTWSNSVRLGGVQVSRDFSLRPDMVTYPLPQFSGEAAVPTTVDLFINGNRSASTQVRPGPFTVSNMPFINGAGEATIITQDAQGRQVSLTLPFYASSTLLKPGLSDYSLAVGALRQDYGIKNFSYGTTAASGSYRYGINDYLTVESHAEGASSLAAGGAGGIVKIAHYGILNTSYTQSRLNGQTGHQHSWGYQYSYNAFSISTQHTQRSGDFANLALYDTKTQTESNDENAHIPSFSLSRRSSQYSTSLAMNRFGNVGAAYIDITGQRDERTRLLNLSWSKSLWQGSNLTVSASKNISQDGWASALSLTIPFGSYSNVGISTERTAEGRTRQQLSYSRGMPSDGGFGWDLAYANQPGDSSYQQASLNWRNTVLQSKAGIYGSSNNYTQWADMSGSLVMMDGSLFASNEISDAFVLISTNRYPNIKVRYENQPIGETDSRGYLLIPRVISYYPAKYEIDTLDLPADVATIDTEQRLSVQRKSGYLVTFPLKKTQALTLMLQDPHGNPLPVSSRIEQNGRTLTYVGWDGMVYLEEANPGSALNVVAPEGQRYQVVLPSAPVTSPFPQPLRCQPTGA
ncbi:fimbria/pilus outer membrane usher protein [Chania multitudinisentens]|uniref:fimbria/pilus outer membrane usher protein n=1 Tax=Chania multitudinisentens TaxID=1639108 RepID=UPI0003E14466|nr:fimbria/pilus outer membrane usher protein [Chania multitudinisentens]